MDIGQTRILSGNVVHDDGTLGRDEKLAVIVRPGGRAIDPLTGETLTVRTRRIVGDMHEDVIGNGVWQFALDTGERERCGIAYGAPAPLPD